MNEKNLNKTPGEESQPMGVLVSETDYTIQVERLIESAAVDAERKAKQIRTVGQMLPRRITAEQFDATREMIFAMANRR